MTARNVTTAEAATRLGLSVRTVRWACASGRMMGAERFGRDWMIPERSLTWYELTYRGRHGPPRKTTSG